MIQIRSTLLLLTVAMLGAAAAAQAEREPVPMPQVSPFEDARVVDGDELARRFAAGEGLVPVIVSLEAPPSVREFRAYAEPEQAARHRRDVGVLAEAMLEAVDPAEFVLARRLENVPTVAGHLTRRGLEELLAAPGVRTVEVDERLELHSGDGIYLMNALGLRPQFSGAGVSIAIVDTGIDYNHPLLGGGGFPNAKVIGGYDTGDGDADPYPDSSALSDNPHGTSCAGLAAGDVAVNGTYIGGVAYGARLYALKVSNSSGDLFDSAIQAAWDWCVTHQYDDPENPILVLSTSIGGGRYTSACDATQTSYAAVAAAVKAAGITSFVSSGNDGYCDAIAKPACVSDVISVGAVYDGDLGSKSFCVDSTSCVGGSSSGCTSTGFSCSDGTSAADKVTCYSNSASFLDLLAPSNDAWTLTIGGGYDPYFGGTSAACPYAAGAAAVLIQAAQSYGRVLTPDDVRALLTTWGTPIVDSKSGISKPRVNLGGAVSSLGTWVDFAYVGFPELGTVVFPFNTLGEGILAAPAGGTVIVKSGSTMEAGEIARDVTIAASGGAVTIGQ